jgi:hypothetical protein
MEGFGAPPHDPGPGLSGDPVTLPMGDISERRADSANYIVGHWRGHLSLPISYWVNGWLLSIGYIVGAAFIVYHRDPSITYAIGWLIVIALGFALQIWQLIGLWRSARKHTERGGRPIWAYMAKCSVVFGWLSFARGIVELFGGFPQN